MFSGSRPPSRAAHLVEQSISESLPLCQQQPTLKLQSQPDTLLAMPKPLNLAGLSKKKLSNAKGQRDSGFFENLHSGADAISRSISRRTSPASSVLAPSNMSANIRLQSLKVVTPASSQLLQSSHLRAPDNTVDTKYDQEQAEPLQAQTQDFGNRTIELPFGEDGPRRLVQDSLSEIANGDQSGKLRVKRSLSLSQEKNEAIEGEEYSRTAKRSRESITVVSQSMLSGDV